MTGAPGPVAIPAGEIAARVGELAAELDARHPDGLVLLPVLPEAEALGDDLAALLTVPVATEGIRVTSFADGGGHAQLERTGTVPLAGRDVVIVSAIVDTGLRLRFAVRALLVSRPASWPCWRCWIARTGGSPTSRSSMSGSPCRTAGSPATASAASRR